MHFPSGIKYLETIHKIYSARPGGGENWQERGETRYIFYKLNYELFNQELVNNELV